MDADLIAKIEKLLALATSDNEHEARLAAAKAYELLHRHNLGLDDVERRRRGYVHKALWSQRTLPGEWRWLQVILRRFFFVRPVRCGMPGMYLGVIVGSQTNVTIAEYVYGFLARTYRRLWSARRRALRKRAGRRAAYYKGITAGLTATLLRQSGGEGPPEDPYLPAAVERLLGETEEVRRPIKRIRPSRALLDGFDDGRRVRLRKGVEGPARQSGRAITHTA